MPSAGPPSPTRPTATGVLVTVRRGKTNQEGETQDVRFVKRPESPPPTTDVMLGRALEDELWRNTQSGSGLGRAADAAQAFARGVAARSDGRQTPTQSTQSTTASSRGRTHPPCPPV